MSDKTTIQTPPHTPEDEAEVEARQIGDEMAAAIAEMLSPKCLEGNQARARARLYAAIAMGKWYGQVRGWPADDEPPASPAQSPPNDLDSNPEPGTDGPGIN